MNETVRGRGRESRVKPDLPVTDKQWQIALRHRHRHSAISAMRWFLWVRTSNPLGPSRFNNYTPCSFLLMSSFFGLWVHIWYGKYLCLTYYCSGKTRTFKPRKDAPEGTKQYQLRKYAEATLVCLLFYVSWVIVLTSRTLIGLWKLASRSATTWRRGHKWVACSP